MDLRNHLLIFTDNSEENAMLVREKMLPGVSLEGVDGPHQARSLAPFANIILAEPALVAPLLERADRLQWLQSTFAGKDRLCRTGLRRDYLLTGV